MENNNKSSISSKSNSKSASRSAGQNGNAKRKEETFTIQGMLDKY